MFDEPPSAGSGGHGCCRGLQFEYVWADTDDVRKRMVVEVTAGMPENLMVDALSKRGRR